jgi:hypothetical protein
VGKKGLCRGGNTGSELQAIRVVFKGLGDAKLVKPGRRESKKTAEYGYLVE